MNQIRGEKNILSMLLADEEIFWAQRLELIGLDGVIGILHSSISLLLREDLEIGLCP